MPPRLSRLGGDRCSITRVLSLFVFLPALHELWSRGLVMAAAAAKEHQRHESTPDDKREHGAKTEGNPAVLRHGNVIARRPDRDLPDNGHNEDGGQCRE